MLYYIIAALTGPRFGRPPDQPCTSPSSFCYHATITTSYRTYITYNICMLYIHIHMIYITSFYLYIVISIISSPPLFLRKGCVGASGGGKAHTHDVTQ